VEWGVAVEWEVVADSAAVEWAEWAA
jgi:hypothetical protein